VQEAAGSKERRMQVLCLILAVVCLPALFQGGFKPTHSKFAPAQAAANSRTAEGRSGAPKPEDPSAFATAHGPQINYGKLPLSFEPNQGQTDPAVKFITHGSGYRLFLTNDGAVLNVQKAEGGRQKAVAPTVRSAIDNVAPDFSPAHADLKVGATPAHAGLKPGATTQNQPARGQHV
jgi:hypothetical protein